MTHPSALTTLIAASLSFSATTCSVDVRTLSVKIPSPPTIVIATFEDGDATPEDPRFETFRFWSYNPPRPDLPLGAYVDSPLVIPGASSNFAVGLNWTVIDLPDGQPNYPGVGLGTIAKGSIDLADYSRIVFTQRYRHEGDCRAVPNLTVRLECDERNTTFLANVAMATDWTTNALFFRSLEEPFYLPPTGTTLEQCLSVVSMITFQAQVDLADGDCASGHLAIDNLSIRSEGDSTGTGGGN